MKNQTRENHFSALLAVMILMLTFLAAHAQTYTWADNAQGQPYEVCPSGLGPETNYFPSNNLWTQSVETNGNCNNTAIVTNAPSNWDPAPPIGVYPGGPGLTGVDTILGAPSNTFLGAGSHLILNSITIETNGSLGIGGNWSIALNRLEFQGDGQILSGVGGFLIGNGGTLIKSGGSNSFDVVNPTITGTNVLVEVDSGTLILPSGFGAVNLDGGTFAVSNNATLLLTVDSGAEPFLMGNITGVGTGTVLVNTGAFGGTGGNLNLPGNMFQWTGGSLKGLITNSGVFNLTNSPGLAGGTLHNTGTLNLADNSALGLSGDGIAVFNDAGGTFNIQGNSSILGPNESFVNSGLLIKSAGAGLSQITPFYRDFGGAIEVDSGTLALDLDGGGIFTNTTFVVSNAALLQLNISNVTTEIEGNLAGSGGGTIFMNNGTVVSSFQATLNFPGSMFQWAGGKLGTGGSSVPLTNLGTINITGPVAESGTIANDSVVIQSGAGSVGTGGAAFNNNPGAVYDIQDDNGIAMTTFNNSGLFIKSAGTGESLVTGNHFNNFGPAGMVEVDSGTLAFDGNNNYFFTNTSFVVSNGASLGLSISNNATELEGSLTGSGGGTVFMNNGNVFSSFPTTLNFPGTMFQWQGGRLGSPSGNLMTNLGTISVSGPVTINTFLVNSGTMIQSGSGSISGSQLQDNAGAVFDIQNDNGMGATIFNNSGLFKKSAGTGISLVTGNHFNGFGGEVEVDNGTLAFEGNNSYFFTNTSFVVSNGASLGLSISNNATELEGMLTGSGGGTVFMNNGTVLSSFPTTLNFPGAMFQWQGGKLGSAGSIPMTNLGTITISGPVSISGTFANNGTMFQTGTGSVGGSSTLDNNAGGVYDIQNDNGLSINTINNSGLFEKTNGTGISIITPAFNNSGAIKATSGMLLFTNGAFVQNAGTLQLSSSVSCQSSITENGGTIAGVGAMGNTGPVAMTVNGGVVAPGNPFGVLSWIGHFAYSMSSPAAFSVVLGGSNQFGQLQVPNTTAVLAGTLNVTLTNGYAPTIGTQFQIISTGSRGGTFSKLNVPSGISVNYSNNGVFLVVTSALPVDIYQPQVTGTNFNFGFGTVSNQSYTIQQNTDLTTTNWTFYTNFIGDGSFFQFITPVTNIAQLFFRVRQP